MTNTAFPTSQSQYISSMSHQQAIAEHWDFPVERWLLQAKHWTESDSVLGVSIEIS
jgi:hypothetical protein